MTMFTYFVLSLIVGGIIVVLLDMTVKRKFLIRRAVSIFLITMAIALVITSVPLFLVPEGIRRAGEYVIFELKKDDWIYWHEVFGILLSGTVVVHVYLNFPAIKLFLGLRRRRG